MKNRSGATIIIAIGISMLLLVFAIGIGKVIQNSSYSIRAFKNKWQAELIADSVKEQLMLNSKGQGAGFTVEEGDSTTGCWNADANKIKINAAKIEENASNNAITESSVADDNEEENPPPGNPPPQSPSSPTFVTGTCSIKGKNNVPVEAGSIGSLPDITCAATTPCFTIPTANTGNAAIECSDKYPVTNINNVGKWVDTYLPGGTDIAAKLFGDGTANIDPLRHPCNWGKLKFGTDGGKKVVVPLYYTDSNGTQQITGADQLYLRVRTPCKPIKERDATKGGVSFLNENCFNESNKTNQECQYRDICSDGNRYKVENNCVGGLMESCSSNKTLVVWQISGECDEIVETGPLVVTEKRPCALIHNQEMDGTNRADVQNSEIYESRINDYNVNGYISTSSYGTLTAKNLSSKSAPACKMNHATNQPKISDFLSPNDYCTEFEYPFSAISNPTLQLAIIVPEIKDIDDNRIPYLEYQIVTNKPIANPQEIFNADVNFLGQNFRLSEAVEQVKNVIDFAIQN